ncbi:MAG: CvpA family protein [Chitinophagales bacterium]|nr:CvpA family protein [Chitinophagales bacterium]
MLLDIITGIFLLLGFFYGFSKGIIHSVFSLVAIIFGIGLAMKGSYLVAEYLSESFQISANFLPVISFLLVVFLTIIVFKITASILHRILKALSLNFINKLSGGALWLIIMILLMSTAIWFAEKNNFITDSVKSDSIAYRYCMPLAPIAISYLGEVIPFFQNIFEQLDQLFQKQHPASA